MTAPRTTPAPDTGTAGPWHVERHTTKYPDIFEYEVLAPNPDAGKDGVCYAGRHFRVAMLDSEADARLIAAAPALRDVVRAAVRAWHANARNITRIEPAWLQPARDALKAAGCDARDPEPARALLATLDPPQE